MYVPVGLTGYSHSYVYLSHACLPDGVGKIVGILHYLRMNLAPDIICGRVTILGNHAQQEIGRSICCQKIRHTHAHIGGCCQCLPSIRHSLQGLEIVLIHAKDNRVIPYPNPISFGLTEPLRYLIPPLRHIRYKITIGRCLV